MNQGMALEQKQTLNLTPQMRQSIKILQMDIMELNLWIEKESLENPVLEVEFSPVTERDGDFSQSIDGDNESQKSSIDKKIDWESDNNNMRSFLSSFPESNAIWGNKILSSDQKKECDYSFHVNTTLHEHLLLNFKVLIEDDTDYKIGEFIIGNIDQNGYLTISCSDISKDLNISEQLVKKILAMIQNCTIPGIGARDLRECLLLQLKHLKLENKSVLKKLILFYLSELSQKNFKKISKELCISKYEVQCLLDIIVKNFEPKPGRIFQQSSELNLLIPDIIVKNVDDRYEIIENNNYYPLIKINSHYRNILKQSCSKEVNYEKFTTIENENEQKKILKYLESKLNSARWIIKCIEQRRKTLSDITRFIIDYQDGFLKNGIAYLRPLSMKKAAESLGIHESTVSRAINNKKIQLPRGFYDMKYFFSKGLSQEKQSAISNEKIKRIIKNYIETENPYFPYSDKQIADLLQQRDNIKIARRTIAKYRKLQGILPAMLRRRYKKPVK
ncbi:MAG: RNA polymerase factor sigma-54 [Atribacterota bacterium]|nr:RNA polymerase factor sigma-54 [Atribacterota bacterium]MDD4764418.1 RNA polymerase factor sigma-54 [Atribacterota bacterium]MDD5634996.1 RNA polymerase factor sigma-54 [Atribacterota bacterium]